jgi:hypothetical protein
MTECKLSVFENEALNRYEPMKDKETENGQNSLMRCFTISSCGRIPTEFMMK